MTKTKKITYWIATVWLSSGMLGSGIQQLLHAKMEGSISPPGVEGITHLGYPVYFLTILGVWKVLGVVALLIPKYPLVKEWAYAGFFFAMSSALFSHIAMGDSLVEMFPASLMLVLVLLSWYFRPASRTLVPLHP